MNFEIREFSPLDDEGTRIVSKEAHGFLRSIYRPSKTAVQIGADTPYTRIIATCHGEVVGTATYEVDGESLYFGGLGVLEKFRRKGVASQMIRYIEEEAIRLGFKKITCSTVEETGNKIIFTRIGFEIINRDVTEKFVSLSGTPLHEIVFTKKVQY